MCFRRRRGAAPQYAVQHDPGSRLTRRAGSQLRRRRRDEASSGRWLSKPDGYRVHERTVLVGHGEDFWQSASEALSSWGVKTRSGFQVWPERAVRAGDRVWLRAGFGPVHVREPAFVVTVVDELDRRGFAYGTLEGHPVAGEEAFVLGRDHDKNVSLTPRSLTRSPAGVWRLAFPFALVAQRWYRRRYERALRAQ